MTSRGAVEARTQRASPSVASPLTPPFHPFAPDAKAPSPGLLANKKPPLTCTPTVPSFVASTPVDNFWFA